MNIRCIYHADLTPGYASPYQACRKDASFAEIVFARVQPYPIVCEDHVDTPAVMLHIGHVDRTRATVDRTAVQS